MGTDSSQEKLRTERSFSEAAKSSEKSEQTKADREVKQKVLETSGIEDAETQEGMESGLGKVSESATEDKSYAPAAGGQKSYSADEIEAIRAKLLAALPPQEVMIKQIRNKLYKQEKVLNKRMKKLQKKSHIHAFELNIVVAQLRKVREYFSTLAHATYELIKHLWLKIVHGV